MLIDLRHHPNDPPTRFEVDPGWAAPAEAASHGGQAINLNWDRAHDEEGHLLRCPACGCRELFARRDFPQKTGMAIVVVGACVGAACFMMGQVVWGFGALGAVALIDAVVYPFTKRCLVCYRCRSEFRRLPIKRDHEAWDLAVGEKYRQPGGTATNASASYH